MADERVQRRLAAILAADVAGYTRLVREDEEGTLAAVKSDIATAFAPHVSARNGRIFKSMGDGLLVEFASVVDAVRCAVEIQRAMAERNSNRPENRRVEFRIGINLGDVVAEDGDLHGDGVNVAARLEGLADPSGIFISGTAFDHVQKNVDVGYEFLGEREVKNIADPVRVYRVMAGPDDAGKLVGGSATKVSLRRWPAVVAGFLVLVAVVVGLAWWQPWAPDFKPASISKMAYSLPAKPSIAVLPFQNFSAEERDRFIAGGMTEDIITALSKVPGLFVISRTSSSSIRDRTATVTKIAEQLGVRYIVEGSIQRSGEKIRITAQLIDAIKGNHLWADNFEGGSNELFALQDDIVRRILVELQVKLTAGDHARVASRGTTNLDAWLLRVQAVAEIYKFSREGMVRARDLLQRAHEADPNWARPLAGMAVTYWFEARKGWTDDRNEWIRRGIALAEKAIAMDPDDTLGYMQLGNLYQLKGDHARAIALREKAVSLAPNDFQANWGLGFMLIRTGKAERAVKVLKHAERLSPRHPWSFAACLAEAQLLVGQYEDSIRSATRSISRAPKRTIARITLAAAYSALGRMDEARNAASELLRIDPDFTVSRWKRRDKSDYKDRAGLDKVGGLLVKAGLPE